VELVRALRRAGIADTDVTLAYLSDVAQYRALVEYARTELDDLAIEAVRAADWGRAHAAALGQSYAKLSVNAAAGVDLGGVFNRVPVGALVDLTGQLRPASPLMSLPGLNNAALRDIGRHMVAGMATGTHPRTVASRIVKTVDIPLARARTIARTEMLRAYRTSSIATWEQNTMVDGWTWHADLTSRTCAACWAMHGKSFPLTTPFGSHPNCRCHPVPKVLPLSALGITGVDMPAEVIEPGADVFARLPPREQLKILGRGKFDAYQSGAISLDDVVSARVTEEWGVTRSVGSLKAALAKAA